MIRIFPTLALYLLLAVSASAQVPNFGGPGVPNGGGSGSATPGGSSGQIQTNNGAGGFGALATGQIPGIATNTAASAGNIGEVITICTLARASATALTTGTAKDVCSGSLGAGDWDIYGSIGVTGTASSINLLGAYNTTLNTLPSYDSNQIFVVTNGNISAQDYLLPLPMNQILLSGSTTIHLVASGTFGSGTANAYGSLFARRRR